MKEDKVSTHWDNGKRKLDRESFDYIQKEEIGDNREIIEYIQWSLFILEIMFAIALFFKMSSLEVIPYDYKWVYILVALIFNIIMILTFKIKILNVIMSITAAVISLGCVIFLISLFEIDNTISKVTSDTLYETVKMSVVVSNNDKAHHIEDLSGYDIGYVQNDEQVGELIARINENVSREVNYSPTNNFIVLADSLLNGNEQAMLINKAYMDIIKEVEGYDDFDKQVKVLYTLDVKVKTEYKEDNKERLEDNQKFIIYISGIDSYGSVNVKSRSDVNIIAVVNRNKGKIQLINTPRDYLVELPMSRGIQDKLTHAGIYGVNTSVETLESLYNIKIDYFFRINFSGFEQIIDELGGIDVCSKYAFNGPLGAYKKGMNHLSGSQALAFARERYAFAKGDVQRGNNQMEVIKAIIEKMTSTDFLKNYEEVMKQLSGCFQTDMHSRTIYGLVREQLADNTTWEINSLSVTGTGSTQRTFSMPTVSSYVMIPNLTDINKAKRYIKDTLED